MNDSRVISPGPASPSARAFVVGVAVSSGSLEALGRFFDQVASPSGMAFVVVGQPTGGPWAFADELLARHTCLRVLRAQHGTIVSPEHVYLIPAETPLRMSGDRLLDADPGHEGAAALDTFFHSLAERGPDIAAVFFGGAAPSSPGVSDVHDAGGLVVVQRAANRSAERAPAMRGELIDWVLPAGEMPRALADYVRKRRSAETPSKTVAVARVRGVPPTAAAATELTAAFGAILERTLPPSVLLTSAGELLRAFGGAAASLKLPHDAQGSCILEAVHPDLRSILLEGLHRLGEGTSGPAVPVGRGIRVAREDEALYDVAVEAIRGAAGAPTFLVSFGPHDAARARRAQSFEDSGIRRLAPPAEPEPALTSTNELESLLSSLADAVYFKGADGKFLRANQPMAERLGLEDPRAAIGKTASEMPNAPAAIALHRDDEAVLRSGEAHHFRLERWEGTGGGSEWTLVSRLPLRNRSGQILGLVGVFHDVTEQKRAEEKVQEAVRRRDQFLAMLSHELRNPLGAIVTATSLLKKQLGDGERVGEHERPLAILQRQSLQMARLLDDLLEANRVTGNTIELRRQVVDLRAMANEAAEASRPLLDSRRVAFVADLGGEALWVDGDAARLQQIHVNLLQNAAKYTAAGGHVSLTLRRDGDEAVLRVADDGAGIPRGMLESVFDLFVQGSRKLDRSQGGMGLGLTLVRSLVAMHGGTVSARSEGEGKGAEFIVRLPLAAAPTAIEAAPAGPSDSVRWQLPRQAKIAVIEDSADNRELLVEALAGAGFECRAADNGIDGLALIEALQPDVAIVDLGLPGMNGYELARHVRADPRYASVRLVALTGYGMRDDRARALAAGFDDHLVKPIQPATLLQYLSS
jgi:PAS domain S-box-containing protein